jgi:hypothetical protein
MGAIDEDLWLAEAPQRIRGVEVGTRMTSGKVPCFRPFSEIAAGVQRAT